jgi:hypothetical protein
MHAESMACVSGTPALLAHGRAAVVSAFVSAFVCGFMGSFVGGFMGCFV